MLDRSWVELAHYERIVKHWPPFGQIIEAAMCKVGACLRWVRAPCACL